jgi:hypothetical protein
MAARAGTKLGAARNTVLVAEKEWAVPVAAAGEDPPEVYRNARLIPVRKNQAFMRQKKVPAAKINGDSTLRTPHSRRYHSSLLRIIS